MLNINRDAYCVVSFCFVSLFVQGNENILERSCKLEVLAKQLRSKLFLYFSRYFPWKLAQLIIV